MSAWTGPEMGGISTHGGKTGRVKMLQNITFMTAFFTILASILELAESACQSGVQELWAYNNPSTQIFTDSYTKYITSDEGSLCQWLIISSHREEVVELYFSQYLLKNSSGSKTGDCLYVYDGPSRTDQAMLQQCSGGKPQKNFVGSGREILVVYERGEVEGERSFTMTYVSKEVLNTEKMLQIAGVVGACIAVAVLVFLTLRATQCCKCLMKNKNEQSRDIGGSSLALAARERDRLTQLEGGDSETNVAVRREARRVQGSAASINRLSVSVDAGVGPSGDDGTTQEGVNSVTSESAAGALGASNGDAQTRQEPDGGSLSESPTSSSLPDEGQAAEMNELPPSYESLFLDENGDYPAEKPPDYTPPKHRKKHPPRRVHTFN